MRESVAISCSVPSRPAAASCSERVVKPEMSTSTAGAVDPAVRVGVRREAEQQARDQRGGRDVRIQCPLLSVEIRLACGGSRAEEPAQPQARHG